MPQSYATANLLHAINRHQCELAPEVEAPREMATTPPAMPVPPRERNPEGRLIFQGLLAMVFFIGMFALAMRDAEIRDRQQRAMIEAANLPVNEICDHLALRGTPYTYSVCRTRDQYGKVVYRREGM